MEVGFQNEQHGGAFCGLLTRLNPVKKVVVSNVSVLLKIEMFLRELGRHGRVVSPMRLIPLDCKSPLLRHVVVFIRQMSMILNNNKEVLFHSLLLGL